MMDWFLGLSDDLSRAWEDDRADRLSLAGANASSWPPCVMQGVGPAVDQDIPLTVRKPLDRVLTENSLMLCQLSRRVLHICCPATHWCQLHDTQRVATHMPLTAQVFQHCGSVYQACPWVPDVFFFSLHLCKYAIPQKRFLKIKITHFLLCF